MTRTALQLNQFGLENLTVQDLPSPDLGEGDVRVKTRSVSLNYRDFLMIQGLYNPRLAMPIIPCSDGVGEVLEVGSKVTALKPGDRVCSTMIPDWESGEPGPHLLQTTLGGPCDGMLASEVVLPENAFLKVPESINDHTAACLPVAGLTAWTALVTFGRVRPNAKVLLLGTGGVSTMALQIAKALGANVAITSSSDEKLDRAMALGADHGINYKTHPKWSKKVLEWAPNGVDLVVEVGGAGTFNQSIKAVRVGGKVALIGVLAQPQDPINLVPVLMKNVCVQGILVGHREAFRDFIEFMAAQKIEPAIDKVFSGLTTAKEAFTRMQSGRHFGKIILDIQA